MEKKKDIIDLVEIYKLLKAKKKVFFMVLPIIFALSCLWIFPTNQLTIPLVLLEKLMPSLTTVRLSIAKGAA